MTETVDVEKSKKFGLKKLIYRIYQDAVLVIDYLTLSWLSNITCVVFPLKDKYDLRWL